MYSFLGDATRKLKKNSLSKSQRKSMLSHVESTYPWLWISKISNGSSWGSFFLQKLPLTISPVRWSFFSWSSLQFFVGPPRRSDVKVLPDHASWKPKNLKEVMVFLQLKEDSRRRFMGHEMFFSPIKLGSEQIRPLNGRFFLFPWLLEKEYAKLKRTSSWLVTSDFYQWSLQLLFKVVDVFFFSGSRDEPDGSQRRKSNIYVI